MAKIYEKGTFFLVSPIHTCKAVICQKRKQILNCLFLKKNNMKRIWNQFLAVFGNKFNEVSYFYLLVLKGLFAFKMELVSLKSFSNEISVENIQEKT